MYYNGIEDISQAPLMVYFKEGRNFGWIFEVTEPINITKLMVFNDNEEEVQERLVTIYLVEGPRSFRQLTKCDVIAGSASWGFEDVQNGGLTLMGGRYLITVKVPNYSETYYVPSPKVKFGAKGIKFLTGIFENINDVGWFETPNCYLVSFEYTLKN